MSEEHSKLTPDDSIDSPFAYRYDNVTMTMASTQRLRQFSSSQQGRNPFHDGGFQKTIRRGPIYSAIFLLIAIPLGEFQLHCLAGLPTASPATLPRERLSLKCFYIKTVFINVIRTSLEGDELKFKLRDTMGGQPRADTAAYTGKLWKTEQTLGKTVLGETEFARCDVHSVVSADQKSIINDWIFLVCIS